MKTLILQEATLLGERPLRTLALAVSSNGLSGSLKSWDGGNGVRPSELINTEAFSQVESDLVFLVTITHIYI